MHMAAFPYQHQVPYALDFAYLPSNFPADLPPPSAQQQAGDLVSVPPCVPCYYPQFDAMDDVFLPEISTLNTGASSSAITTTTTTCTPESSTSMETARRVPSVNGAPKAQCFPQKRKERQRCNFESEQSKDSKAGKGRKLRKRSGAPKKAQQEPPTGYVHVRARRGEATDSHSLAERVRRERIREKMQLLQDLVPGCHKVVGKALLLEEIINYVQSLQSQVEFLSMKLASMDPMLCDFGSHLDDYMIQPQRLESMSPEVLLNVQRTGHLQPTAFADATNSYPVHDSSVQFLLHEEGPFGCFRQDSGSNFIVQVRDQRQSFLNQIELNHMSFQ